ncbi:MAG: hypothetical protein AB7Q27_04255 [Acidimicrobiia bacterium]
MALTLLPTQRRAWYWSALVGPGRPLVTLSDLHVPFGTRTLEIRSEGLWADHICEEPMRRWTIGNEAFAVALDDPESALGDARGTLTPFGVDLEWEATADPELIGSGDGYEIAAVVHGEVLVADERLDITADGRWWHRWGHHSWAPTGDFARRPHGGTTEGCRRAPIRIETDDEVLALEHDLTPDRWRSWLRPLFPPDDGDRTRRPPATS